LNPHEKIINNIEILFTRFNRVNWFSPVYYRIDDATSV